MMLCNSARGCGAVYQSLAATRPARLLYSWPATDSMATFFRLGLLAFRAGEDVEYSEFLLGLGITGLRGEPRRPGRQSMPQAGKKASRVYAAGVVRGNHSRKSLG